MRIKRLSDTRWAVPEYRGRTAVCRVYDGMIVEVRPPDVTSWTVCISAPSLVARCRAMAVGEEIEL